MKNLLFLMAVIALTANSGAQQVSRSFARGNDLLPPATPLVACDPYFSIWSQADRLTDTATTHWTGREHPMTGLVRIDGEPFQIMGAEPANVPALEQTGLEVFPTRTVYSFAGEGVALKLTFLTPAIPYDMDVLSRPVTYLDFSFESVDGAEHEVTVFFAASGELAVNSPDQEVQWESVDSETLKVAKIGSTEQHILAKKGDDLRIDWGYLYAAAPSASIEGRAFGDGEKLAGSFAASGRVESGAAGAGRADAASVALVTKPLKVSADPVSKWMMLAYDDLRSIEYNHKHLRPYWRRSGWEAADLLAASASEFESLRRECEAFDAELMADLEALGGVKYAKLAALAFRQCFAAGKFVADENGQPLQFSKENHSNGCIATSDVFYPMAPQFLLFGPTLAKSFIVPFMNYAVSDRWKFPFAPHDLGTYPKANGQVYGGGETSEENQMPVEECGNLLILMAAVAQMEGNADFPGLYWDKLKQWAEYLKEKGYDPENQLCTDDFAGHLAHNVNLSAKAICGLGAFAKMAAMRGDDATAAEYRAVAQDYASRWVEEAWDGDHYRLTFDRPGTWSQKYNLIWDEILDLNLFPRDVATTEMAFYRRTQNIYGLPLDNRDAYTKLDWILWTATLTQDKADFEALVAPVFRFLNETSNRSPMTDWYRTHNATKVGFTARPVVGGVFAQTLYNAPIWSKYAERDRTDAKGWAPMPDYVPPVLVGLTPTANDREDVEWRFTTEAPADDWFKSDFNDSRWRKGVAGFGTEGTPGAKVRTVWNTSDIWLRRTFELPADLGGDLSLKLHHDENSTIYINGVKAASVGGFNTGYDLFSLTDAARAALRPGRNSIAVHCHQSSGGQYIDAGIVRVLPGTR